MLHFPVSRESRPVKMFVRPDHTYRVWMEMRGGRGVFAITEDTRLMKAGLSRHEMWAWLAAHGIVSE